MAVSRNDKGSSDAVNFPKKESIRAANVLFREPVLPDRSMTNLGSHPAPFRKWFRGLRKVKDSSGRMISSGARGCHRILRVARTCADLSGSEIIGREHVLEACCFRNAGKKFWNT